ncbi:uncharacterized protein LOC132047621 [Lycium ferocissimum]|uniref:uncharacterized protein LOC132047621 n=1 Tax=Lycium ferocissimum TaxID=112874 RepID=UPI00281652C4|nr:uncharacterized protein LOC132047621 [Lycium ferocissimum]
MEGLSKMLVTAGQHRWIKGFNPCIRNQGELEITHLLYADDSLIFCEPEREQIYHLKLILLLFEAVSGLHINFAKSVIYPLNEIPNIKEVADIMGCKVGVFLAKYLGLPLGSKAKAVTIWNDIVERCEKKLSSWKRKYLSLGSRVVLINSVLDSLPTYTMS